ncbi:MAG TPA: protein translocase SEC61 complex subunit gamma [Euryarchaeota archaeon]|nr:protein translocase SEC61 complex subunit gamma [Euryarchaeota archaeon]
MALEKLINKGYEIQEKVSKSLKTNRRYSQVLHFAQKPEEEEFAQLSKVSIAALLFVGFLGFLIYIAFYYLMGR